MSFVVTDEFLLRVTKIVQRLVPHYWKVSSVVPVSKSVRERSTAKNYHPVSLHSVVSQVFENTCK